MIILYPSQYKNIQTISDDVEVIYYDDDSYQYFEHLKNLSGMYDIVILKVEHVSGISELNYNSWKKPNVHFVITQIDCNYSSSNLKLLINKYKQIENIWNEQ